MDACLLVLLSISVSAALALLFRTSKRRLPPGPLAVPLLGNLIWLRHSTRNLAHLIHDLHHKYGPILTLRIGSRPIMISIADRAIAHKALVDHGAVFADRPAPLPASRLVNNNQHNITSAGYGPLWRLLRRNLTSEILHSSRVKLYGPGRNWVLTVLTHQLRSGAADGGAVVAMESFQFAMFCLLVLMCVGEKLDERAIRDIEAAERSMLLFSGKLTVFAFAPRISKYVFRKRWSKLLELRERQMELYVPLIRARREHKLKPSKSQANERYVYSYLDSLLDMELSEEGGRRLTDSEMVALCSEFLIAGTDTTSTALQWIMARLVKHQDVQERLAAEIESMVGEGSVEEEDLHNMPYLKAVVLEGLRLHPPAHFVLPHAVTEETTIEGYSIPKGASVNFMVVAMNRDGEVWEEPMEFKPERFLAGGAVEVDITGTREIKMMPFGVGRRICPAHGLAMLHLEYFVANLVKEFEWKTVEGEEVDFSEKQEFTIVMKNPLRARIFPRERKNT